MTTISPSVSSGEHAARSFAARRHGAFIDGRFEVLDGAEPASAQLSAAIAGTAVAERRRSPGGGTEPGDAGVCTTASEQ